MTFVDTRRCGIIAVITVAALGLAPAAAKATLLLDEQFNYPNGDLDGHGGWSTFSGTVNAVQIADGRAVLAPGDGDRADVVAPIAHSMPWGYVDVTYVALVITVHEGVVPYSVAGTFAEFHGPNGVVDPARMYVAGGQGDGDFTFAFSGFSLGVPPVYYWPHDFGFGTTHLVVAAYDAADGSSQMWVDPVSELSESIRDADGPAGVVINAYALCQGRINTTNEMIDSVRIGTSFSEVVAGLVAVEPASWGDVKALFR